MNTKRLCVDCLKEKYKLDQSSVIGLMIGARATFTQFFIFEHHSTLALNRN